MSELGQSRRLERAPVTSGLPRGADILSVGRHVSNVPKAEVGRPYSITASACASNRTVAGSG